MHPAITALERNYVKPTTPQVQSGDTVRIHQKIREGSKQRIQVFEGVVIRTHRMGSTSATLTVRRIASGVGVEKTYLIHSPNVDRIEILRRAKVRRNFLSYLRERRGKSARLQEMAFDKVGANAGTANVVADDTTSDIVATDDDTTEIVADENQDALNDDTISINEVEKQENKDAREEDIKPTDGGGDEDAAREEEFEQGVDRAQPSNL